jgi:hypothetical protein
MSVTTIITLPIDPPLGPVARALTPAAQRMLTEKISKAVVELWIANFDKLGARPQTAFWAPRPVELKTRKGVTAAVPELNVTHRAAQGFWNKAAALTHYNLISDRESVVSVNLLGVRLRFYGGDIDKIQTIPAIPEAVGTVPKDWPDLKLVPNWHGPETVAALVMDSGYGGTAVPIFWLTAHTHHEPDPAVIPEKETAALIDQQLDAYLAGVVKERN